MAILLNRKYPSRLECLYYILKTTYNNFKKNPFIISNVKYNEELPDNILNNCDLLKTGLGRSYCPYLDNPLDSANVMPHNLNNKIPLNQKQQVQ